MELQPAYALSLEDLAALFNHAFTDYIGGSVHFTAQSLARFLAGDNVDLHFSQVVMQDGQPVGFGLVSRRGWTSRLAGFGIAPDASGQGIGKAAMLQMIAQARERGDHFYELEVIEGNTRAVRLYSGVGFNTLRRLVGYRLAPEAAAAAANPLPADLHPIDIYEAGRVVLQHAAPDLPWQIGGAAMMRCAPPDAAYTLDGACAVLSNPHAVTIVIRSLIVPPGLRRQGRAERLLRALFAAYPGKTWMIPVVCPEETGAELAARLGFERHPLTQLHMRLAL
jgi:ribosomal protein S18 acetylase RimI-like enzyme